MAAVIDDSLRQNLCDIFKIHELRPHQNRAIQALSEGKDVFIGTRTGSGKSLAYECYPLVSKGAIVLVIAPLVNIMSEQCKRLIDHGFKATYIGKDHHDDERIAEGYYDFVFGSPECFLDDTKWRNMLKSSVYQERLKLIVVDEAHTVIQWGESLKGEDPFRVCFSRIGELRSLCKKAQVLALTATSGPTQRRKIMRTLCFLPNNDVIVESPERNNIKITTMCIPVTHDLEDTFRFLLNDLARLKENLPRHVIFCETIVNVSKVYSIFVKHFGQACEMINMYHSKTTEKVKEKIRNDLAVDGKIRILICTNSAGMGVNFYGLNNIIHYGLPREMDTFVQQMGRAGRDGNFAHELVLYTAHKKHLSRVEDDLVKLVKDESQCRHYGLCHAYATNHEQIEPKHNCCDVCQKICKCSESVCPRQHAVFDLEHTDGDSTCSDVMKRLVSDEERKFLRDKLFAFKFSLCTPSQPELIHGLTDKVIEDIVQNCDIVFTSADILSSFAIWSCDVAVQIFNIISEVFGETEMLEMPLTSDSEEESEDK
ncbi:ATP-dependent DNA helicase Q-like SIM [Pecten maximus]|uniref:ATP-dependent DNA helicase Q-like SIM n=1 Tax=Pecten maximus TaxID=6579 RepID=UPI00145843E9|nr:ATP-dependent DNA helicase Q-like SIM [Pecten maximus]